MKYQIKRGAANLIEITPTGWQTRQAMGVNHVEMTFTLQTSIKFLKGDWCVVYGEKYYFINDAPFKKVNQRQYEYSVKLVHEFYSLQDIKYMGADSADTLSVLRFSLMGDAVAHMGLLIQNANRVQSGWTIGVVDATIAKNISYDGENLLQVLNRLASEFDTEYWIENKTIHLSKRTGGSGIQLSYGRDKGLLNLTKSNKDESATIFTRLYVEGGSQNLPNGYRNGSKSLLMPSGVPYIQNTDLVNLYGVIEGFQAFDDIYPKRIGTITGVGDEFTFTDSGIDFDFNDVLIANTTAKIIFQTGLLAGYQFELSSFDNPSKTFVFNEIKEQASSDGVLPNTTLKPAIGDTYIIVDIQMPPTYVSNAESELQTAAQSYYTQGSDIEFNDKFSGDCDPLFFKRHAIDLHDKLGFTVNLFEESPEIDVDKRMATIKRDLQNEWKYELDFTDKIELSALARTYAENKKTTQLIYGTVGYSGNGGNVGTGSGGSNYFLSQLSGSDGYLYIAGVKTKAGFADMAQDAIHAFNADLALVANVAREVVSVDYVSGFAGAGHKLVGGVLEVDHIIARKSFETYELIRRKVTGIGGSFAVTDDMKILSVTGANPYVCIFDTDNDTIPNYFRVGDIVRCQTFDSNRQKYYVARVNAISNDSFTLSVTEGSGIPSSGDVLFRFDNDTDNDRKGLIYMTNSDSGAPFIDFTYGFYTNPSTKTKVRLGNTAGIYDVDFGGFLNGYNLYADGAYLKNLYAKGQIIALPGSNVYNKTEVDGTIQSINDQIIILDGQLANFASDGVLNGIAEKQPIKIAYDAAANEVEDLKTQATSLGVSSADYNAAFINLQNFVLPLLTDLTSVSYVDGVQLRDKFNYYGVQKSLLVKNMQARQKDLTGFAQNAANNANNKIDNLKIGGANLVHKSRLVNGYINIGDGIGYNFGGPDYHDPTFYTCKPGDEFRFSVYETPTGAVGGAGAICWYNAANVFIGWQYTHIGSTSQNITHIAPAGTAYYRYGLTTYNLKCKLEKGNIATDWSESSIDVIARTAKLITITGTDNVIKVDKSGNHTPASPFTVSAVAQNTTITSWQYRVDGGSWSTTLPTGVTRSGNVVTINPTGSTFKVLSINASDGTYSDTFTVARAVDGQDGADGEGIAIKGSVATYAALPTTGLTAGDAYLVEADGLLYIYNGTAFPANGNGVEFKGDDGAPGEDAYTVILTNESHTFAGTETAAIAASTSTDIITYKGSNPIAATITIGTLPTGLTASLSGTTITFNATTALVSAGSVDITIVIDGKTFVRKFSFAISFKGATGKSVTAVDAEFAKTNSATVAPVTGWQTTAPSWEQGYYIWSRQKTTYSDATSTYTPAINITGSAGSNGKSIASIEEEYYLSTSKTTPTGGSWSATQPTWEKGKYLATRIKITYSNPTSTEYTNPVFSTEWEAVNQIKLGGEQLIHYSRLQGGYFDPSTGYGGTTYGPDVKDYNFYNCVAGDQFVFTIYGAIPGGTGGAGFLFFYGASENFISAVVTHTSSGGAQPGPFIAPAGSAYYRYGIIGSNLKAKLEKGNIATDYSISDIDQQAQITAAQDAASNAQSSVSSLNTYVDGAFKDGIVDAAEAKAIEKYINVVNETYEQLVSSYNVVYNDPLLTGTPKTNLATAKSNLDTSKNALLSSISTAIADGQTTVAEKNAVDAAYVDFKDKIGLYTTSIEQAYKSITDAINTKTINVNKSYTNINSVPSTGYNVNDRVKQTTLQNRDGVNFEAGKYYKSTNSRASGFVVGDWVEDVDGAAAWAAANNAQTAANNAQTAANNAQTAANNANNKIDNLKVGGVNLINKSRLVPGFLSANGSSITVYSSYRTDPTYYTCSPGDEFMLTIHEWITSAEGSWIHWYNNAEIGISSTPVRYGVGSWKETAPSGAVKYRITIGHPNLKVKLEKGNIKSDYTESEVDVQAKITAKTTTYISAIAPTSPAITDLWFDTTNKIWKKWNGVTWETVPDSFVGTAAYLTTALSSSTEITGGLILNSVIGVRNSGSVTAYMNGVNSNPIAFAAGVTGFGTGSEARKLVLRHDGSGYLAGGNVAWDTAGNVAITGAITATSGTIGGFTIGSQKLTSNSTMYGPTTFEINAQSAEISFTGQFIDANADTTRMNGNGIISNSSNTSFMAAGITTNASVVGLLRRGNNQDFGTGADGRGLSAGIAGINQTTKSDSGSRTYGGYFNSVFIGELYTGRLIKTNITTQTIPNGVTTILFLSGSSGATMNFPALNVEEGRIIMFKNLSGGTVYANRSGLENLVFNNATTGTSSTITNKTISMWQRLDNKWIEMFYQTY